MKPRKTVQLEADKTYAEVIAWSKTDLYRIVAVLIDPALFTCRAYVIGRQYNSELFAQMNVSIQSH